MGEEIRFGGHRYREHRLQVPLVWGSDDPRRIEIFAREVVREGHESDRYLVWFQGGPGNRAQRPEAISGWLDRALDSFRVLLLDQRGTGLSTAADKQTMAQMPAEAQAEYLSHFRARDIVLDAEALRESLGSPPWTALGQSFGGFIVTSYLSHAPNGLTKALITAGLPPLTNKNGEQASAADVYRETYPLTLQRCEEFFARYPGDRTTAGAVARHLSEVEELLPTGERLTPERFQQVGISLGTASGFDPVHYLLEDPFISVGGQRRVREHVLAQLSIRLSFATNPMYATLHETIYGRPGLGATRWAAHRVRDEFEQYATPPAELGKHFVFAGEHIYPWQFEQDPALVPLQDVAHLLAEKDDWADPYDSDALAENGVPVAAALYTPDMFVPFESQRRTAAAIRGLVQVVTSEYQHDGIRTDGQSLLGKLLKALD